MKVSRLFVVAAMAVMLALTPSGAGAQQSAIGAPRGLPPLSHGGMHGRHGVFFPVYFERDPVVIVQREVVREVPVVVEPPPPPPKPREPYVVGKSYASLPGGCMKMIQDGASYYLCSGEWYRQEGSGGAVTYKAVAQP